MMGWKEPAQVEWCYRASHRVGIGHEFLFAASALIHCASQITNVLYVGAREGGGGGEWEAYRTASYRHIIKRFGTDGRGRRRAYTRQRGGGQALRAERVEKGSGRGEGSGERKWGGGLT